MHMQIIGKEEHVSYIVCNDTVAMRLYSYNHYLLHAGVATAAIVLSIKLYRITSITTMFDFWI